MNGVRGRACSLFGVPKVFSLTAAGLISTHGMAVNRSGSRQPPGPGLSVSPSLLASSHSACVGTAQLASGPSQASSSAPLPDPYILLSAFSGSCEDPEVDS